MCLRVGRLKRDLFRERERERKREQKTKKEKQKPEGR
jgi:hypothetical protein